MAYTPEVNGTVSALVRRVAWAAGMPMTSVLQELVLHALRSVELQKVCVACKDRSKCDACRLCMLAGQPSARVLEVFKDSERSDLAARFGPSVAS